MNTQNEIMDCFTAAPFAMTVMCHALIAAMTFCKCHCEDGFAVRGNQVASF